VGGALDETSGGAPEEGSRVESGEAPGHEDLPAEPGTAPDARSVADESAQGRDDESIPLGSIPSDRWIRAVGRRGPARAPGKDAGAPNGNTLVRAANDLERQESARDHAAARVRPAGEPLARAKELVQQGRVDEAIELYLGILTVNPSNLKAHNNLGVLLDELRQYDAALEHLAAAEQIAPENVEVLTNYACALTSVARYDHAETLLRKALKLDAESLNVRLAIGILYFRRGLYAQAEQELRWVCARSGTDGHAFYYRGEALNRLGRFDEARQAMERAKTLMPNDPRPFYTLGHLYDRQHQPEEAAEMYRQARRLQKR
jgi:tetratricopeptide (TPR) repeat protein